MKFSAATVLAAAAAGVAAHAKGNVTYVTEVVDTYVTYCPEPTELTLGGKTYTITEATTITIENCGCTVTKPVITTSAVVCHDCPEPAKPTHYAPPANGTVPVTPGKPTGNAPPPASTPTGEVPANAAGKVAALSGAGLAGIVGLAAFIL